VRAAVSVTALAGCDRARDGRGMWGVRLEVRRVATGSSREGHGWVTRLASRDGERGKSTLPCVLDNRQFSAAWIRAPIGGSMHAARFGASFKARKAHEGDGRVGEVWSSRHLRHGFVPGVPSLARTLDVSPTSARTLDERRTPSRPGTGTPPRPLRMPEQQTVTRPGDDDRDDAEEDHGAGGDRDRR